MGKCICGTNSCICATSRGYGIRHRNIALSILTKVSDFKFRFLSGWTTYHINTSDGVFYCINTNVNIGLVHNNNVVECNICSDSKSRLLRYKTKLNEITGLSTKINLVERPVVFFISERSCIWCHRISPEVISRFDPLYTNSSDVSSVHVVTELKHRFSHVAQIQTFRYKRCRSW